MPSANFPPSQKRSYKGISGDAIPMMLKEKNAPMMRIETMRNVTLSPDQTRPESVLCTDSSYPRNAFPTIYIS